MNAFSLFASITLNTDEYEKALADAGEKTDQFGGKMKSGLSSVVKAVTSIQGLSTTALGMLAKIGLDYNSQMEQYTTNFTTMLGNQEAAIQKVNELKEFAASTPLSMDDLATGTQTLLAFGVASENSTGILRQLGDIALGNADKMERLAVAFGKANAQGKVTGDTVQQMIDAGWNPLIQISEAAGETMEETQKRMSAGAVSVEELRAAMEAVTSGTGQFAGGMEAASHTMAGMTSTLKDNASALLGDVVQPLFDVITGVVLPASIAFVGVLQSIVDGTSPLSIVFAAATAAVVAYGAAMVIMHGQMMMVTAATKLWTVAQTALNFVLSASPTGLAVAAIAALVAAVSAAVMWIQKLKGEAEETAQAVTEQADGTDELALSTDELTKSIEAAMLAEQDTVPVLEALRESTLDLADANDTLSDALEEQEKNGSLSLDTALKLIDAGYGAAIAIDEETGAVTLNKDSYVALTNAKIDDQIAALETQRQSQITSGQLEAEAMSAQHTGSAYWEMAAARRYAESTDTTAIDAQIAALRRAKDSLGSFGTAVTTTARRTSSASKQVKKQAEQVKTQAEQDLETYKALKSQLDHEKNLEVVSEREYYQKLLTLRDNYLTESGNLSEYQKITEEIYKYNDGLVDSMSDTVKSMSDAWGEYQKEFDSRSREIFNSYKLFEEVPERQKVAGQQLINNLKGQISNIQEFYDGLAKLSERGISEAMVEDIRGLGVGALDELSALLTLSDDKLSEYSALYAEKQAAANKYAADELENLRNETIEKIQGNLDDVQQLYDEQAPIVGGAFTDGLSEGILSGMSSVVESAIRVSQEAVNATKDVLGGPKDVGGYLMEGLGAGVIDISGWLDSVVEKVKQGMNFETATVDFASSGMGRSSSAIINSVSGEEDKVPVIPLTINLLTGNAEAFATWLLPDLIRVAKGNGTPITDGLRYA